MTPGRGRCLVKRVETAESYAGAKIILPQSYRDKQSAYQVEILRVGRLGYCEDEDCERPHIDLRVARTGKPILAHRFGAKKGDWCLIAPRSLVESGEPDTYVVAMDDFVAVLTP